MAADKSVRKWGLMLADVVEETAARFGGSSRLHLPCGLWQQMMRSRGRKGRYSGFWTKWGEATVPLLISLIQMFVWRCLCGAKQGVLHCPKPP